MNQKGPISSWHFKSLNTVPHLEPSWRITYEMSSFHKVTLNGMTLDLSQLIVRNAGTLMKLLRSKSTFAPSNRFPSLLEVVKPADSSFLTWHFSRPICSRNSPRCFGYGQSVFITPIATLEPGASGDQFIFIASFSTLKSVVNLSRVRLHY